MLWISAVDLNVEINTHKNGKTQTNIIIIPAKYFKILHIIFKTFLFFMLSPQSIDFSDLVTLKIIDDKAVKIIAINTEAA